MGDVIASSRRLLLFRILRYNPQDPDSRPQFKEYQLEEADAMTLFIALNVIREEQDPSLQFDFVCRAGICGSCGMLINGRPGLACRTLTASLPEIITLAPLPAFELIGDLSVNTGKWMRAMSQHLETWIHSQTNVDIDALEERMEPELAQEIYELERCIECGCCVAACGTVQMRPGFAAAVGLNKVARLMLDPRDERDSTQYYELVGNENGVFGCLSLMACEDHCPKDLPLAAQLAWLRRRMASEAVAADGRKV